VYGVKQTAEDK